MDKLILICCLLLTSPLMAEVYRSYDENGNVVFTDKPGDDAELIEVDKLQTVKPPPVKPFTYTPKAKVLPAYTDISITSPEDDVAIRDNGGNVTVNISVKPGIQAKDNLVLYLDGKEIPLGRATAKAFSGLDRGTHQLRAVIKDPNGRIQISSTTVSFHLLRHSVK